MGNPTDPAASSSPACRAIRPEDAEALSRFFERLRAQGVEKFFHPHPFTAEEAAKRAADTGRDFYCLLTQENEIMGYGMLRGWEAGYAIPSLGIVIDPGAQGHGHGRRLMEFLHTTARQRGASHIRLKVYLENIRAMTLYRSLGYVFQSEEGGQAVGLLALTPTNAASQKESAE
jgi:ribosomal protein S18 acetylase RimI-like enzyme